MYGYDIFHESIMKELINTVHNDGVNHAYLFTGEKGVGKSLAARLFAASLVCRNKTSAPCGVCHACLGAKNNTNPDIMYIRPTDKKSISTQQAREIVADAYVKPFESEKKVYIVEDASLLNEFAQNCLLKILEEPPEYIVFILIAANESVLLQTVQSRCTHIRFPLIEKQDFFEYIKTKYPDNYENGELLYRLAQGIPGRLDAILNDADYDRLRIESFEMLYHLFSKNKLSAYKICDFLDENKENAETIIDFWQSFLRDILIIKNVSSDSIMNIDMKDKIKNLAYNTPDNFPVIALEQLILANTMLSKYVNLHILGLKLSFSIKKRLYGQ